MAEWNPNAGAKNDLEFIKLNQGESITGKYLGQEERKRKDGSTTVWYRLEVDSKVKVISSASQTLKRKLEGAPENVIIKISYSNSDGKNFYNVERVG